VAVHASRFLKITGRTEIIDTIFADEREAVLPPREQALFDFAAKLSTTPVEASVADAKALADVGMSALEQLDLVLSAAIFGWANRLMHTLGEPIK
jgi:uncharacterized peroxidase-related enzyme